MPTHEWYTIRLCCEFHPFTQRIIVEDKNRKACLDKIEKIFKWRYFPRRHQALCQHCATRYPKFPKGVPPPRPV